MRKKKEHHEEHVDETWLIPYADMLTLLLALFIVMFAMSKTDQEKFKQVSEQFNIVFAGGSGVMKENGGTSVPLPQAKSSTGDNVTTEENKMNEIKKVLQAESEKQGYSDKVKIDITKDGLYISMQDVILFNSGDANVVQEGAPLLLQVSKMLVNLDNNIRIVGYTDNVPIRTDKFRSNWDLSAMRAINVMNFMVESGGLRPDKLSIQAYGEFMPKFDNSTDEGRAKNRRVEIFIARQYPVDKK